MAFTPFPTTFTESGVSERSLLSAEDRRVLEPEERVLLETETPVFIFLRGGAVLVESSSSRPRRTELALEEVAEVEVEASFDVDELVCTRSLGTVLFSRSSCIMRPLKIAFGVFPFVGGWWPIFGVYVEVDSWRRGEVSGLEEAGTSTKGSLLLWPLPFDADPAAKNLEVMD